MADAIYRIAKNLEEAQVWVNKAKEKVLREFTIEKMAHEYARYLSLVA